jgi:hypothetical protein
MDNGRAFFVLFCKLRVFYSRGGGSREGKSTEVSDSWSHMQCAAVSDSALDISIYFRRKFDLLYFIILDATPDKEKEQAGDGAIGYLSRRHMGLTLICSKSTCESDLW